MQPDPMKPLPKPAAETHSEGAQKRRQRSRRSRFSRDANHPIPDPLNVRFGSKGGLTSQRHSMSALPLKVDIHTTGQHVRKVP